MKWHTEQSEQESDGDAEQDVRSRMRYGPSLKLEQQK